jgi:uncharacterized protein YlzI (FlbEa/FlbD family)
MRFVVLRSDTTSFAVNADHVTHIEKKGDSETVVYVIGGQFITVRDKPDDVIKKLQAL